MEQLDFEARYRLIERQRVEQKFEAVQVPYTPNPLIEKATKKARIKSNHCICVFYTVEWAVYLQHIGVKDITVLVRNHCEYTERHCELWGFSYIIYKKGMKMKQFDAVVGNPPYKQGLWRTLMQQALDLSKRYVVMVSPDGTIQTSTKYAEMKSMLEAGSIQSVTACQKDFVDEGVNVVTSSEIVYYVFDKTKPANQAVFNKNLTKEQQLTLSIISRVKALTQQYGTLTESGSIGTKDKTATGTVNMLKRITQSGAVYEQTAKNKARYLANPQDYFFVNKFFGMNSDDLIYATTSPLYFSHDNIYSIGNISGLTPADFKRIYLHKLMRFVLSYYRGTNTRCLGWSIRELPKLSASTKDLYQLSGLTVEEIAHVESNIK
jgi:hypothetical protein